MRLPFYGGLFFRAEGLILIMSIKVALRWVGR